MKRASWILLFLVLAALLLAACGGPNYNIYGTWRDEQGTLTMIFQQSGHVIIDQQGAVQNQLFEFTGPDTILLKAFDQAPADKQETLNYSINGDKLVLVVPVTGQDATQPAQNVTVTLTRVK